MEIISAVRAGESVLANGRPILSPAFLLNLIQGLPPGSMLEANTNGEPTAVGWTVEAHLLASASDWSQVGAISGGNWKKKAPDFNPIERPFSGKKKKKQGSKKQGSTSVAELHRMLQEKRLAAGG